MFVTVGSILLIVFSSIFYIFTTIIFFTESDKKVGGSIWVWSVISGFVLYSLVLYFLAVANTDDKLIFSKECQIETTQDPSGFKCQEVLVNGNEFNITQLLGKQCPDESKAFIKVYDTSALGFGTKPRYSVKIIILDSDGSCIKEHWTHLDSFTGENDE